MSLRPIAGLALLSILPHGPGVLATWPSGGGATDYVYGVLAIPDTREEFLVVWNWRGDSLKETSVFKLPRSLDIVPATGGLCGLSLGREKGPWPYALLRLEDGKVVKEWTIPAKWWILAAGGSPNGKFIAFAAKPGPGEKSARVALIDVEKVELAWVGTLEGHGGATVRTVVVSNDGRYVAVAGWDNGTAMVDAKERKVLWAKRPKGEILAGYAVFAPDGEFVYTAGSQGCVYQLDVATGDVQKQRWATSTGKTIYAHRVSALAASEDGRWLAAGTGPEGEAYLWDLQGDAKPRVFRHGEGTVEIVGFSPDARNMVTVGGGRLKVWELPSPPSTAPDR